MDLGSRNTRVFTWRGRYIKPTRFDGTSGFTRVKLLCTSSRLFIKPGNMLCNSKKEIKIADFGVRKIVVKSLDKCNSFTGTCAYMSPEKLDSEGEANGVTESFGLTILEILVAYFSLLPQRRHTPDRAAIICANHLKPLKNALRS
ncbi:Mitogen-activated protein kinase kinase 8 [Cardamine amara subsp. amara]|uniref:Mitogen-activated protein kinase kinase 8 n=1 Tax=Cardamine amara subsp. amara TaxID=228776 RepID=A0ABD1C643_CARAN